jgi:hypothetical protein
MQGRERVPETTRGEAVVGSEKPSYGGPVEYPRTEVVRVEEASITSCKDESLLAKQIRALRCKLAISAPSRSTERGLRDRIMFRRCLDSTGGDSVV